MESKKKHVILFPFMAQGHITPFLQLANLIHKTHPDTYKTTLINTPLNIKGIQTSLPPNFKINLKALPFHPSSHNLPPEGENTSSLPFPLFIKLLEASETLRPSFEKLLVDIIEQDGGLPLCIISDNFLAWTVDVARKFSILHSVFITMSAYGSAIYFSLWEDLPHRDATSDEISPPTFPDIRLHRSQLSHLLNVADGTDAYSLFMHRQFSFCKKSDVILANTAKEFEDEGLKMLHKLIEVPVLPIGPLIGPSNNTHSATNMVGLMAWLDSQSISTVLYISFGSQNTITATQMMELAMALAEGSRPFIWVIRPPVVFDVKGEFRDEWLPENFEERIKRTNKGILVHHWASQVEILSHPLTGAFLSHCGWNSVLESLIHGVPIIRWPLAAEQTFNSKFLEEEVGVCVEVARGNAESTNSNVKKEQIERVIEVVMGDEEKGREMRRKAKGIGDLLRGALKEKQENGLVGSSIGGLEEFLQLVASK